jgi:hypothetical protein
MPKTYVERGGREEREELVEGKERKKEWRGFGKGRKGRRSRGGEGRKRRRVEGGAGGEEERRKEDKVRGFGRVVLEGRERSRF